MRLTVCGGMPIRRPLLQGCEYAQGVPLRIGFAASEKNWHMVRLLLDFGADHRQKDWRGRDLASFLQHERHDLVEKILGDLAVTAKPEVVCNEGSNAKPKPQKLKARLQGQRWEGAGAA